MLSQQLKEIFPLPLLLFPSCHFGVVVHSGRRRHERDARGEAVRLEDDREQRARDEGAAHGPRDGESPPACGPAVTHSVNQQAVSNTLSPVTESPSRLVTCSVFLVFSPFRINLLSGYRLLIWM